MIYEATSFECSRIAQDLQIRKVQVENVVQLFNEGNTVPFITRYRKERTGGLNEDAIRQIQARLNFLKHLSERKQTILRSIENQGKLTDELRREIFNAQTILRLEDLYLPFKPKRKSLAAGAREKGLEPLALAIWHSDPAVANLAELLPSLVNPEKQLNTIEEVQTGVKHILAEMINETAEVRAQVRRVLWKTAAVSAVRNEKAPEGKGNEFKPYFQFKEAAAEIRPHRILALNRGEKEGFLKVKLEWPVEIVQQTAATALAEQLLKVAGAPAPAAPPQPQPEPPVAPPSEMPAPPPTSETPPAEPPSTPPPAPPETPPIETPPNDPAPAPPEMPTTPPSPAGMPPQAAPMVESLSTEVKPELTGDLLAEGASFRSPHTAFLKTCLNDALDRLMLPSLEREIRTELTDEAELHAVKVFAHNIQSLLMQPPLIGRRVLAIDPGFRTGCKLAALDEFGNLLDHTVIFPHGGGPGGPRKKEKKTAPTVPGPGLSETAPAAAEPAPVPEGPTAAPPMPEAPVPVETAAAPAPTTSESAATVTDALVAAPPTPETHAASPEPVAPAVDKRAEATAKLVEFAQKHNLNIIAIGNGTACRETEEIVSEIIASSLSELAYVIVSEAGASVYSVSPIAKDEFPTHDPTVRSGASIGRRLQDPLSELVKIDPQSLGVGLYQHDMGRKELKEALEGVVESCVNQVGVDVNTASLPLLRYVSGLNQMVAREIVEYRKNQGPFTSREQLLAVSGMGPGRYTQAAGFLKIPTGPNPFDRTWIHPESYPIAEKVVVELGFTPSVLDDKAAHPAFRAKLNEVDVEALARTLEVGLPTLDDIFHALAKPGRDPREELPPPIFKKGVLKLEDLQAGMELKGTVLNVVDFGAFVDVGLKESGLVHISQMANKYIKSPYEVVSVNDIVTVWVLKIDKEANHVSLTMIKPGSERGHAERGQRPPRREGDRPPQDRGQRPPPRDRGPGGPQREGQGQRDHHGARPPQRRSGPPPRQNQGAPPRREDRPAPAPPPPPLPRKPRREAPKPKLTQAAMEGKAPLRTLSELAAFFAAKEEKDKPAPPPPPVEETQEAPPSVEQKQKAPPPPPDGAPSPPEASGGEPPSA